MTPVEIAAMLPEDIVAQYMTGSHDIDDAQNLVYLGETQRQTPIWVNKQYYQSDLKIVAGDIEPHHFAGFSGGVKTAAIGLAGRPTVNHNHAMLVDPNAWIGIYDNNPLRQDIEEIGLKITIHLALNILLNQEKKVVAAFAGNPVSVMKAGIPVSRQICGTPINTRYDLVIASAGGKPKDINFYQAQKALTHSSLFCKENGIIILAAACPEGTGSRPYDEFMQDVSSVNEVLEKFRRQEFKVGPHKAFQVARLLSHSRIILATEMEEKKVNKLLLSYAPDLQTALDRVLIEEKIEKIAGLPHATTTIPNVSTAE
jgi:nickel-dependent lactate racemase